MQDRVSDLARSETQRGKDLPVFLLKPSYHNIKKEIGQLIIRRLKRKCNPE